MRKSKEEAAESRARILAAAARLFRARGPESVSVAEVMQAAGMTHGGFYKHFASKDALLAATIASIFEQKRALVSVAAGEDAEAALAAYIEHYLSPGHVESLETGCPIAGLTLDAIRANPEAKAALADGSAAMIAALARLHGGGAEGDTAALHDLMIMVGAVVLARAVNDDGLRARILAGAGRALQPI
jgi:TetR/AcrR family transcriptional repressor of nem operon